MVYSIIKVVNGAFSIHAEGYTDISNAKVAFHGLCQTLWNAPDVITAEVAIMDEDLNCAEGYREFIHHEPIPTPEPEPETESEPEPEEEPEEE